MEFNIVIGNPPYNDDMYIDFVQTGYQMLKDDGVMVMITPAKWQAKQDEKNMFFKKNELKHIKDIIYFKNEREVFDCSVNGGLTIFSMFKGREFEEKHITVREGGNISIYDNPFYGALDLNDKEIAILRKFANLDIDDTVVGKNSTFVPEKSHFLPQTMSIRKITDKHICIGSGYWVTDSKEKIEVNPKYVSHIDDADKYTLVHGHWFNWNCACRINEPRHLAQQEDVVIYAGTLDEVKSAMSYYSSKLIWWLVCRTHIGCKLNTFCFEFVPDPGAFDHIFTDAELYAKYGLTADEISIIESVIKERK